MNNKTIRNYQIFSFLFVAILGTLLHFTYKLSGENAFVAAFSSINESVWEHLKLLYFPMLLTIIIGSSTVGKNIPNFLCSKTIGMIVALLFTVVFFYTYTGILGYSIAIIDIASFFVAAILGEYVAYKMMLTMFSCNRTISIIILIVLGILFVVFTYYTPELGIFKEPQSVTVTD